MTNDDQDVHVLDCSSMQIEAQLKHVERTHIDWIERDAFVSAVDPRQLPWL
jgi:hypothetical protein